MSRLPYLERAVVPEAKITDYLLSPSHPAGRGKAAFFEHFGFSAASWQALAEALLRHASAHEVAKTERTPFGTNYVVEGTLHTPSGRMPAVRSVWFIGEGKRTPRLVSAYPLKKSGYD